MTMDVTSGGGISTLTTGRRERIAKSSVVSLNFCVFFSNVKGCFICHNKLSLLIFGIYALLR